MSVLSIQDFIVKYYIDPIVYDTGYNPVNTLTWGILLGISLFGLLKLLEKLKITVDQRFILSIVPYILVGSALRVMEDAEIFTPPLSYLFVTPLVYFVVFAGCVDVLLVLTWLHNAGRIGDISPTFGYIGVFWALLCLFVLLWSREILFAWAPFVVIGIAVLLVAMIYSIARGLRIHLLLDKVNISIIWAHLFDASSTFIGADYMGYVEKHVLSAFLTNLSGTALVMYPLKIGVVIPALFFIDSYLDEKDNLKNLTKLAILVLGLAPGTRNVLRITLGV